MFVSAWKGGTEGYGVRVARSDVRKHFDSGWTDVQVEIDGSLYRFNLTGTFFTTCPELRGGPIRDWLNDQGLIPWLKGRPPKFEMIPLEGARFRLERAK